MSLKKNPIDFMIGCDAEWIMVDGRKLVCEKDSKAHFGCDGVTGALSISEVRTKPFYCPLQIVNNIKEIFQNKINEKPYFLKYKWMAGSFVRNRSIGSHIHYGISKKIINPAVAIIPLEQYVGSLSVLLENREEGLKRRKTEYGQFSDFRPQFHGGFEQRSFGSFLHSPHASSSILCLGKVVMYELINNPSFKWNSYFNYNTFNLMETSKICAKFPIIWKQITEMTLYPKYKKQIDFLKFLIDNKLTFIMKRNMKDSWGLIDTRIHSKENKQKKIDSGLWSKFKAVPIAPSTFNLNNLNELITDLTEQND